MTSAFYEVSVLAVQTDHEINKAPAIFSSDVSNGQRFQKYGVSMETMSVFDRCSVEEDEESFPFVWKNRGEFPAKLNSTNC